MDWQFASRTHRGNIRKTNEDSLLVEEGFPLLVVADGMGGHQAGDVASQMLVDSLAQLRLVDNSIYAAAALLESSIKQCNVSLIDYSRSHLGGQPMGTTVVAMLADDSIGICLWAGDSRLYCARGQRLEQITEDHSYVAELVSSGQISAEEAMDHPSSNIITRAVGAADKLSLDNRSFGLLHGDTYLLCSDGLYNELSAADTLEAMSATDINAGADRLLERCLNGRARDNVTFVVARVTAAAEDQLDSSEATFPGLG
jgi:serine/threonine protein phosphatase PrpC